MTKNKEIERLKIAVIEMDKRIKDREKTIESYAKMCRGYREMIDTQKEDMNNLLKKVDKVSDNLRRSNISIFQKLKMCIDNIRKG